jgi:hypothetical protein
MRAALVNCSAPHYNLGLARYAAWLRQEGWIVQVGGVSPGPLFAGLYDLVAFSAIFSWDVPALVTGVRQVQGRSGRVEIGGPGTLVLADYIECETGVRPVVGLDPRFERQRGEYEQCFTSRGCPRSCFWCIVPRLEGSCVREYDDFDVAPIVLDNNLLATSVAHQERVVETLLEMGCTEMDLSSGFDARLFDEDAYERFSRLPLKCWRFAFDRIDEERAVREVMEQLGSHEVPAYRIRVYVLVGNESIESCLYRAQQVIAWGGEPFVQPLQPLDTLEKNSYSPPGWEPGQMQDLARYINRFIWRKVSWEEYDRHFRTHKREREHCEGYFVSLLA